MLYRGATGYVKSYNAAEAARSRCSPCVGLFFAHRPAVLLCRPLLVLVSARFIRDAAPVCEGVIFFTLSERPRTPSCPPPPIERTPTPLTPVCKHSRRTVAFVCVGSMGIDILFPIVRARLLSFPPAAFISSLPLLSLSFSRPSPPPDRPSASSPPVRPPPRFFWPAYRVFFNYNSFSYPINH